MYLLAENLLQCRSSLCLHPRSGLLPLCFYIASLWLRWFLWVGRKRVVFAPSFLNVWSHRPWRIRQLILFFAMYTFKNSSDCQNCNVVDLFLRKSLWFFLSIFSILGSMRLRSRALYILSAMDVRIIPRQFLANPRSPFLREAEDASLCVWLYTALQCRIPWSSILLGVFHQALLIFYL